MLSTCREIAAKARKTSGAAGLDFLKEVPDFPELKIIPVGEIKEDVDAAARIRDTELRPMIEGGEMVRDPTISSVRRSESRRSHR